MSGLRRRKRSYRVRYYRTSSSQNNYFLVSILSLIILFETILLLFLLPKAPSAKISQTSPKKKIKIETKVDSQKAKEPQKESDKVIPKKTIAMPIIPKKVKGKIAIVIDDWGYNTNNLELLKEIDFPLTLAILPFLDYSNKVAQFVHENNYEIIIHMPMEPDDKTEVNLEPKTLMVNMGSEKINEILDEAFLDIPYAKGINNHMGSLATRNKDFVSIVFKKLKENNLYFLDSYVVPESVCYEVAKKVGIKFARRRVFLDNEPSYTYIRGQLMELIREADKRGYAVGIGHDRENTLKVLKEVLPQLAKEGYRFVFVSEIVK